MQILSRSDKNVLVESHRKTQVQKSPKQPRDMQNKKQFLQLVSNETEHVEFTPRKLLNMSIMYNCIAAKQLDDFSYRHIGHFSFPSNQSLYCLLFNFSFSHNNPLNPMKSQSPILSHVKSCSMYFHVIRLSSSGSNSRNRPAAATAPARPEMLRRPVSRSARKIPTVDGGMVNGKF